MIWLFNNLVHTLALDGVSIPTLIAPYDNSRLGAAAVRSVCYGYARELLRRRELDAKQVVIIISLGEAGTGVENATRKS